MAPADLDDGWVLATLSLPEQLRADRRRLRTRLTWLGFDRLGGGIWIAPRDTLEYPARRHVGEPRRRATA